MFDLNLCQKWRGTTNPRILKSQNGGGCPLTHEPRLHKSYIWMRSGNSQNVVMLLTRKQRKCDSFFNIHPTKCGLYLKSLAHGNGKGLSSDPKFSLWILYMHLVLEAYNVLVILTKKKIAYSKYTYHLVVNLIEIKHLAWSFCNLLDTFCGFL